MAHQLRSGQVMLEYVIITGIAFIIGALYLSVTNALLADTAESQRSMALNDIGYLIQDEFIVAATVEDGYVRNFQLPIAADRFAYDLNSTNTSVVLHSGQLTITYELVAHEGTLQKGWNTLRKDGTAVRVN